MAAKTMHGARAVVRLAGPGGAAGQPVGTFSSFSYGLTYDIQTPYILGRFSAPELVYTGMEPVRCTAEGWRIIKNGPHVVAKMPKLQDLLFHEYIQIDVLDRQSGEVMAKIRDVRPETYSSTISSRQLVGVTHSFMGLLVDDESATNNESAGASDLPPVI